MCVHSFKSLLVSKLAREEIGPLVRKMDKEGKMDEGMVRKLFENGVSTRPRIVRDYNICMFIIFILIAHTLSSLPA